MPCMGSGCPAASGSSLEAPLTCRPGTQNQPQTPRLRLVGAMPRLPKRPREGAGVMLSRAPSGDFSAHPHGAGCQAARPAPAPARGSPRLLLSCWAGCQQRHVGAGGQVPSAQAVVIPLLPSGLRRAAASPGGKGLGLVWSCGIWEPWVWPGGRAGMQQMRSRSHEALHHIPVALYHATSLFLASCSSSPLPHSPQSHSPTSPCPMCAAASPRRFAGLPGHPPTLCL